MKKILFAIAAGAAILSAVSCSKVKPAEDKPKPAATTSLISVTTTAAITTTAATTTTAPLMPPMTDTFQYFEGFDVPGSVRSIYNGPDNTVAVQVDCYDDSKCYVFDQISDKIIRTVQFPNSSYNLLGMFSNGTIVVENLTGNSQLYLYSGNSDEAREIDVDSDGYLMWKVDRENDVTYWIDPDTNDIMKVDESGKVSRHLSGDKYWDVYSVSYGEEMVFIADVASEETGSGMEEGLYSFSDGRRVSDLSGSTNTFLTKDNDTNVIYNYTGDDSASSITFEVGDKDGRKAKKAYNLPYEQFTDISFYGSSKSEYGIASKFNYSMFGSTENSGKIYLFDVKNGLAADTGVELPYNTSYINCCYSENIGRWLIGLNRMENMEYGQILMMIDPEKCDFNIKLESTELGQWNDYEPVKSGTEFRKVREEADKVEDEFGVRILIGNEVMNSEGQTQYIFHSTEEDADSYTVNYELDNVKELRKTLALYPRGFFSHFKTNGKCGLRIALVLYLESQEGSQFSAGGVAYNTGAWYDIAINSTAMSETGSSLHHEIWHSVESLVNKHYGEIKLAEWNRLNPEGFEYTDSFEAYAENPGPKEGEPLLYNVIYDDDKDYDLPYFIYDYSMINPREDRATLVEQMFRWDYDEKLEGVRMFDETELRKYPHLRAKLDFIANWSKQEFGYVYWEKMLRNMNKTIKW